MPGTMRQVRLSPLANWSLLGMSSFEYRKPAPPGVENVIRNVVLIDLSASEHPTMPRLPPPDFFVKQ